VVLKSPAVTVPENVPLTPDVIAPLFIDKVPSVSVPPCTVPENVAPTPDEIVPPFNDAVPSVSVPPVIVPPLVNAPLMLTASARPTDTAAVSEPEPDTVMLLSVFATVAT